MAMSSTRMPPPTRNESTEMEKKRRMASPLTSTTSRMIPMDTAARVPLRSRATLSWLAVMLMKIGRMPTGLTMARRARKNLRYSLKWTVSIDVSGEVARGPGVQ